MSKVTESIRKSLFRRFIKKSYRASPTAVELQAFAGEAERSDSVPLGLHSGKLATFVDILTKAHISVDRCHGDWSVRTVCQALRRLIRSDHYQVGIVDAGCLPILVDILLTGCNEEVKEVLLYLRNISSASSNHERMLSEPQLTSTVTFLYYLEEDGALVKVCGDILLCLKKHSVAQRLFGGFDTHLEDVPFNKLHSDDNNGIRNNENKFLNVPTEHTTENFKAIGKIFQESCEHLLNISLTATERGVELDASTAEFKFCMKVVNDSYLLFDRDGIPANVLEQCQSTLNRLMQHNGVLNKFLDTISKHLRERGFCDGSDNTIWQDWWLVSHALRLLLNYDWELSSVKRAVSEHKQFLPLLFRQLQHYHDDATNKKYRPCQRNLVHLILLVVHNVSFTEVYIRKLSNLNVVMAVQKFLTSSDVELKLTAAEILARLAAGLNVRAPDVGSDLMRRFIDILSVALQSVDRCHSDWHVWRLCQVLGLLSSTGQNQGRLLESGCLPPLVKILIMGEHSEITEALLLIKNLSSERRNRHRISREPFLELIVSFLYHSESHPMVVSVSCDILLRLKQFIVAQRTYEGRDLDWEDLPPELGEVLEERQERSPLDHTREKLEVVLKHFQKACDLLQRTNPLNNLYSDGQLSTLGFMYCVKVIKSSYHIFKPGTAPVIIIGQFRSTLSNYLIESGVLQIILDYVTEHLTAEDLHQRSKASTMSWWLVHNSIDIMVDYTCDSADVRQVIAQHEKLLALFLRRLEDYHHSIRGIPFQRDVQEKMLATLHNVSLSEELVSRLRELNVVKVVRKCLDSPDLRWRLASISMLARVVTEVEANDLLRVHTDLFVSMIETAARAVETEDHEYDGWKLEELVGGLKNLARCDANKIKLVKDGILSVLASIFSSGWPGEQHQAIHCLKHLTFEPQNKLPITSEPRLVLAVGEMHKTMTGEDKKSCFDILQTLREWIQYCKTISTLDEIFYNDERTNEPEATPNINNTTSEIPSHNTSIYRGHIMVSYESSNEEVVKKICSCLRGVGFPVWIGDNIRGSGTVATAHAVENAAVVLVAMSQTYRDCNDCKDEAEYARTLKKPILPLIVQPGYTPDGWLGLRFGSKTIYDFTGEMFHASMEQLVDVVRKKLCGEMNTEIGIVGATSQPSNSQDRRSVPSDIGTPRISLNKYDLPGGRLQVRVETCTQDFFQANRTGSYSMERNPKGLALIINVYNVRNSTPREGTDIDRDNLKDLLTQLGYVVIVYNDNDGLTAEGIKAKIKHFSTDPRHASVESCFVCLLSHGEENCILGNDGEGVKLSEIYNMFNNQNCQALLGKPKIFISQSCRGKLFDSGTSREEPDAALEDQPLLSDMIRCYPSQAFHQAFRHTKEGSWFIGAIVNIFMNYAKCKDICAMMNLVNDIVSRKVLKSSEDENDKKMQMSEYLSTLRKAHLYFFPGILSDGGS